MTEFTNEDRAAFAEVALQTFTDRMFHGDGDRNLQLRETFEQNLSDLLADFAHLCDERSPEMQPGELWRNVLARAEEHYVEEFLEEVEQSTLEPGTPPLTLIHGGEPGEPLFDEPDHFVRGPEPEAPEWTV